MNQYEPVWSWEPNWEPHGHRLVPDQYGPVRTSTDQCLAMAFSRPSMHQYGPVWTSMDQYGPAAKLGALHRRGLASSQHGPVWTSTNQYKPVQSSPRISSPAWPCVLPVRTSTDQYGPTLVTAVVQLVVAEPGGVPGGLSGGPGGLPGGSWSLRGCGVACLVRDSPRRSYFIRIFRLPEGWAGLNFASEAEAATFEGRVQERLRRRQQRKEKQLLPPPPPPGHG
ncbi:hypothetical protein DUI87_00146 [Hirundo rustica rustica]|uniref:WH1 domain-containing protein n=1 Tax=Hirundo rustica rustica TaxID=333673 RepID=A0A3M0LBX1_HIRRU|nr:hypothetical protein DUI87_00146 [Hirundo rustica rustica]